MTKLAGRPGPPARCLGACESIDSVRRREGCAERQLESDGGSMTCARCFSPVCVMCQRHPVTGYLMLCEGCEKSTLDLDDTV